jgi:hypothetical protein
MPSTTTNRCGNWPVLTVGTDRTGGTGRSWGCCRRERDLVGRRRDWGRLRNDWGEVVDLYDKLMQMAGWTVTDDDLTWFLLDEFLERGLCFVGKSFEPWDPEIHVWIVCVNSIRQKRLTDWAHNNRLLVQSRSVEIRSSVAWPRIVEHRSVGCLFPAVDHYIHELECPSEAHTSV